MTDGEPTDATSVSGTSVSSDRASSRTVAGRWPGAEPPQGLLDLVDQAVVMCDEDGVVRGFNGPAAELFPRLGTGHELVGPMATATARLAERFECDVAGRTLSGYRRPWNGGVVWLVRDVSGARDRERDLLAARERSSFLHETAVRLGGSLHHGRTVRALVQAALPVLADTAIAVLPVLGRRSTWYLAGPGGTARSGDMLAETLLRVSRVAHALTGLQRRAVVCRRDELGEVGALMLQGQDAVGEALVIPLSGNGVSAGALVLVRGPERPRFGEQDIELAEQFAARAGLALATASLYSQQTRITAVMQADLAPRALPDVDGIALGAAYRPAAEALLISGDFYHVAPEDGGGVKFFFGDVRGKGAEAALLAGQVRQSLRTLALVERDPLGTLRLLNRALLDAGSRFTTLVMGSAHRAPNGGLTVTTAGGGHLPPLVLRRDGRVEAMAVGGTLLGILPDAEFALTQSRLEPGELMLLYSDGVTEARGGPTGDALFGDERLIRDLAGCLGMQAGAVTERVELLTTRWLAGRPHDDIAVLAIQAPHGREGGGPR